MRVNNIRPIMNNKSLQDQCFRRPHASTDDLTDRLKTSHTLLMCKKRLWWNENMFFFRSFHRASVSLFLSLLIRGILSLDEQTQDPAKMEDINYLFEIAHFPGPDWMNLKWKYKYPPVVSRGLFDQLEWFEMGESVAIFTVIFLWSMAPFIFSSSQIF